jgi:hypothetical protein
MGHRDKTGGMWNRNRRVTSRRLRSVLNAVAALVASAALLGVLGFGFGTIPALGPALDPGRGSWTSASGGQPAGSQTLRVPGLAGVPPYAGVTIVVTLLLAALQARAGAWLARALLPRGWRRTAPPVAR